MTEFSKLIPAGLKYYNWVAGENCSIPSYPQPFVRPQTFLFFVIAPLLIACAYKGTIVQKAGRPLPFTYSLGIDASYKFALRNRVGHIRWQLVSAAVFNSYQVGDDFNDEDLVPPRHRCY